MYGLMCSHFGNMTHCLLSNSFPPGCSHRDKRDYQYLSRRGFFRKRIDTPTAVAETNRLIMDAELQMKLEPAGELSVHLVV